MAKLNRKEKKFIVIGLFVTIFFCSGLYINHQLSRLMTTLSSSGLLFVYPGDETMLLPFAESGEETKPLPPAGELPGFDQRADSFAESDPGVSPNGSNAPGSNNLPQGGGAAADSSRFEREITAAAQRKLNRPLEKKDLLKAGLLILRKLNTEEISYLYRIGVKDSYTREELWRAREILLAKLSAQDISTLKEIAAKYGKQLRLLDADF